MIVLDTNVISEMTRPVADQSPRAAAWLQSQKLDDLWVTSVTYAELLAGLYAMPEGKRRRDMIEATKAVLMEDLKGRIAGFDASTAEAFAEIAIERRRKGLSVQTADIQIAAIALSRGFAVATRNVADFGSEGLTVINPWDHPAP